jgi:hypothetical protein
VSNKYARFYVLQWQDFDTYAIVEKASDDDHEPGDPGFEPMTLDDARRLFHTPYVWPVCDGCDRSIQTEGCPPVIGGACTCAEDDWYDERDAQPDTPSLDVAGFMFQAGF